MKKKIAVIALALLTIITISSEEIIADPIGPDSLTAISSSRRSLSGNGNKTNDALAGNVTELSIDGVLAITKGWQGYYGNISGEIILDDANNNTLYSWNLLKGGGEIYATRNDSIDWSGGQIICANITHISTENDIIFPGANKGASDNITETFNFTTHPLFSVGSNSFNQDQCNFSLSTYVNDAADASRTFNETILYSLSANTTIYMAYIINDQEGFKAGSSDYNDFQMLVGEEGYTDSTTTTTYYFYVELEQ